MDKLGVFLCTGCGIGDGVDVEKIIEPHSNDELKQIDVDLIERGPWQPREHFDEEALKELAESIAATRGSSVEEVEAAWQAGIPLRRLADPSEIAAE